MLNKTFKERLLVSFEICRPKRPTNNENKYAMRKLCLTEKCMYLPRS